MAKKQYRVGVIGRTGKGNYGHGLDVAWNDVEATTIVAVADENAGGLAAAAKRTGAKQAYADYREMLEREELDIVALCSRWIDQHHEICMAALDAGCHIYMEKPFCRTLMEADDVVLASEMRHLKLAIAHTNRYSPQVRIAKSLIKKGDIGDILEVRARGKEDARRGGGEDLWVLGTHMLDLMRMLVGDATTCYANVSEGGEPVSSKHVKPGNEGIGPLAGDTIDAMYSMENDVTGFFSSHRGKGTRFGLRVFGSKGAIEFQSGYGRTAWILKDTAWSPGRTGSEWTPISAAGVGQPETQAPSHNGGNVAAVKDLISAIENDRQPVSSVYDARAAMEMIVGIFESHRVGGPVNLPLEERSNPLTRLPA